MLTDPKPKTLLACALFAACASAFAAAGEPVEDQLAKLLLDKQGQVDALMDVRAALLKVRLGPADHAARACINESGNAAVQLAMDFRTATDHLSLAAFNRLRREDPDEARELAEEVMAEINAARERFNEAFVWPPQNCMLRE